MKTTCTIIICSLLAIVASGQNFRALKGHTEYIYSGNLVSLIGVKADSVHFDGDSIYFPSRRIRKMIGSTCYDVHGPSWLGSHVRIKPDGTHLFFNVQGDTITILAQAELNTSWVAWQGTDGAYAMARVSNMEMQNVLGVMDMVKSISFQMYNTSQVPTVHNVNSMELKMSEIYGMVTALSFVRFPVPYNSFYHIEEAPSYSLSGLSNPPLGIQNLTAFEIWDFQTNDTIQVKEGNVQFGMVNEFVRQWVFLDRQEYADSIVFDMEERIGYYSGSVNNLQLNSLTTDTIQKIIRADHPISTLPLCSQVFLQESDPYSGVADQFKMEAGDVRIKLQQDTPAGTSYDFNPVDSCWQERIDVGCFSGAYYEFIEGLGGPYIYCQVGAATAFYRTLTYYNKGGATWGTPFALSTNNVSAKANFAKVYPNPASDFVRVELPQNILPATIRLFDLTGRMAHQGQIFQTESQLELSKLLPGFYTWIISTNTGASQSGKVVLK